MGNIEGYPLRKIDFSGGEKRLLFAGLLLYAPCKIVIWNVFFSTNDYSQTRSSVPVANKLMNSLMEK